jgi:hypothetical protein
LCKNHLTALDLSGILGPPTNSQNEGRRCPSCIFVSTTYVALNDGDYIVIRMGAPFSNGPGDDIRIHGFGSTGGLSVSVSIDLSEWSLLGTKAREPNATFIPFDLGEHESSFPFIRLKSTGGENSGIGPRATAVEALYPISD